MKKAWIKHILSLLLFGMNGIVAARISLSSYEIVLFRTLIGSLFLAAIFVLTKQKVKIRDNRRDLVCLLLSGVAMGASWMFLYEAYQQVGVSIATLIYYCGPIFVMLLSVVLFREKITWKGAAGFITVLAGVVLINGTAVWGGSIKWGIFCGVMSAATYAVMVIANKKTKSITGLTNSMLQLFFAFLTVALFVGCKQGLHLEVAKEEWFPILVLGLINTGFGCYLYFSSIGDLPVQTVALCGYMEPLSAVIFSAILLKERMSAVQIVGAVLILGGALTGQQKIRENHIVT
ncbi:MAG: EamA family transporter [Lachnospiraceae bacterium]|nr:EamA family transporter [Lachnospiraceae bacterium]